MGGKFAKLILLASILCFVEILSKELYVINANARTCTILDRQFIKKATCTSKNVNRTLNISSREIIFQPGVSLTNYYINMVIFRRFGLVYRQFMLNVNIDVCDMLSDNAENASVMAKLLNVHQRKKYGNYFDPCPISGRRYEDNVTLNYDSYPDIIPSGVYRMDVTYYTYVNDTKKEVMFVRNMGEVKTTTAEQWK